MRSAILGALQTLGTIAAFVLAGVAAAALYPLYPAGMPSSAPPDPVRPAERWLVDGYNVIQVALLAGRAREDWWKEARRAELLERADALLAAPGPHEGGELEVQVVFDGPEPAPARAGARAVFAPSADDWILAQLAQATPLPIVVTADRSLAARARNRGAQVMTPAKFLSLGPS